MSKIFNNFIHFVNRQSQLSAEEKRKVLFATQDKRTKEVINLILILSLWSVLSFFVESTLIGGGIIFGIVNGMKFIYFLPEIIFVVLNIIAKVIFIKKKYQEYLSFRQTFYAVLPTVGPLVLLGSLIKNNMLLVRTIRLYIVFQRKQIFSYFSFK